MSIWSLVYASVASRKMTDTDLKQILLVSRRKNQDNLITGMLLYMDPFFIQALEGDISTLEQSFSIINQDPRHEKIRIIYKQPVPERIFPEWNMGFNKFEQAHLGQIEGLSDFLQRPTTEFLVDSSNRVLQLLNLFRREILF
jgi:hypothetical protein